MALYVALGIVLLLIYQAWDVERQSKKPGADTELPLSSVTDLPALLPQDNDKQDSQSPVVQDDELVGAFVTVETDLLRARVSTVGGTIYHLELLRHPTSLATPSEFYPLLADGPERYFVVRSGLISQTGHAPDHRATYVAQGSSYRLEPGQAKLEVPLVWRDATGLTVRKVLTFSRDSYLIGMTYEVANEGDAPWVARQYVQLVRRPGKDAKANFLQPASFQGAAYYSPAERFKKITFDTMQEERLDLTIKDGWVAMIEHYFLAAVIPPPAQTTQTFTQALPGGRYVIGTQSSEYRLGPAETARLATQLYAGPKEQGRLKATTDGLVLAVDYGVLTALAQPVFWLLKAIYGVVGNWGWSIIFVTLIIKLLFYRLSATSYRSMAKMKKLQPRMLGLRERYGDNRQMMSQKMMELYKEEKFNPLGGCLPILVQIPVFIALYWVLLESVELRQANFVWWLKDLSSKDPYYVLPVLMCLSMVVQTRLNPAPVDPVQAKVMMAMPLVFGVLFALFPAGLVLYWLCNNLLSIGQQWLITHNLERAGG